MTNNIVSSPAAVSAVIADEVSVFLANASEALAAYGINIGAKPADSGKWAYVEVKAKDAPSDAPFYMAAQGEVPYVFSVLADLAQGNIVAKPDAKRGGYTVLFSDTADDLGAHIGYAVSAEGRVRPLVRGLGGITRYGEWRSREQEDGASARYAALAHILGGGRLGMRVYGGRRAKFLAAINENWGDGGEYRRGKAGDRLFNRGIAREAASTDAPSVELEEGVTVSIYRGERLAFTAVVNAKNAGRLAKRVAVAKSRGYHVEIA